MATKKGKRRGVSASTPKALRKQLRKAEAERGKAVAKRDRAQARVEALSIIADEIRAQLADIDKAEAKAAATKTAARKTSAKKPAATAAKPATASTPKTATASRGSAAVAKAGTGAATATEAPATTATLARRASPKARPKS